MTQRIGVFTKPWRDPIDELAARIASLGVDVVELPIRPGFQVTPDTVAEELPRAIRALADAGITVCSVAAPLDERVIAACADNGVQLLRTMVEIPKSMPHYLDALSRTRARFDQLLPLLDRTDVAIGVQNHSGYFLGSAIGLHHLIADYDPRNVRAILDMAHCAIAGEPLELCLDLLGPRLAEVINFKNVTLRRDGTGRSYAPFWTTGPDGVFQWDTLTSALQTRGYEGTLLLHAEYSSPYGPDLEGEDVMPLIQSDVAYLREISSTVVAPR